MGGNPGLGDTVCIVAANGEFLAYAAYSPASQIRARCWSFVQSDTIDAAWFATQMQAAVSLRAHLLSATNARRMVFGEGDGLPGFVADLYDTTLVVQCMSAGAAKWRDTLVDALIAAIAAHDGITISCVVERSDAAVRQREGLPDMVQVLRGSIPNPLLVHEHGVQYAVDVLQGHKTGFYIDQRDSRKTVADLVAEIAQSRTRETDAGKKNTPIRVLNCFSYTGGFSLAAMRQAVQLGVTLDVVSVDSSELAIKTAQQNARLNGIDPSLHEWRIENVDVALKALHAAKREFDIVVLDPPKFAPSAASLDRAARAYKDVNLRGLRVLANGGHLLTFSCSGVMGVDLFQKVVAGSCMDSGQDTAMMGRLGAGRDHPMRMTHPEGEYLKGLWLQRV